MSNQKKKYFPMQVSKLALYTVLPLATDFCLSWSFVEKYRKQIESNHSQKLEELARRGGLSPQELLTAIEGKRLNLEHTEMDEVESLMEILRKISGDNALSGD